VGLVAAGMQGLLPLPVQAQETPPVPPGVVFLVDNHESMQDYPQYLPEAFTPGYYPTRPSIPGPETWEDKGPPDWPSTRAARTRRWSKMMDILESNGARHPDGSLLMFDPSDPATNPNVGGVNYCDLVGSTKAACDYTAYNWPTGLAVGNKNFMDDVAFFLANTDLRGDMPGKQTVRTFVVGYGDSSPMLKSIALAGRGSFFRADQPGALRDVILFSLGQGRANSCSAP